MYDAGKVAIVANAYGSNNRRHDHSQLIMLTGDTEVGRTDYNRNGWGGRLVEAINDAGSPFPANVVSMAGEVPIFCFGDNVQNRLEHVVHAPDTRAFGFNEGSSNQNNNSAIMARALSSYYGAKGAEVAATEPDGWPFRIFYEHEQNIRAYSTLFNDRLDTTVPSQPDAIAALRSGALNRSSWGRQCANLYDSLFATDILGLRVAHMDYGGFDTHDDQQNEIEGNLSDIFGSTGGLATVMGQLALDGSSAGDDLVFTFSWDFGRQLRANGTRGTDHGNGNYQIVMGNNVLGGVFGEMFHPEEIATDANGDTLYDRQGSAITGRTSIEEVFKVLCDWVEPGTGATVFAGADGTAVEDGVTLNFL